MNINIILWTNVLLAVTLLCGVLYYIFLVNKFYRRETFALIVDSDGLTKKGLRLNLKRPTFAYDGGRYNIALDRSLKFGNKKLMVYRENRADPVRFTGYGDSRLDADTYQHILDNAVIRALNSGGGLFAGMDMKKWLLIGGGVLLFFVASSQGWI